MMKKTKLILLTTILSFSLFSCGNNDNGRASELTPSDSKTIDTKQGIAKLSNAASDTFTADSISINVEKTSTFAISGTTSLTQDDATKNETYDYDINITNPIVDCRGVNLTGTDANLAKASIQFGGDFKGTFKRNGIGNDNNINATNVVAAAYLSEKCLYVNASKTKNLAKQFLDVYLGNSTTSTFVTSLLDKQYKYPDIINDENMPLISSSITDDIDDYLTLFSNHADDYKEFLKLYEKDGTYSFYLSLNKEDLIRILTDYEADNDDDSDSEEVTNYEEKLKDSTVNAFELLVTFSEEALISCDFNIDMNIVDTSVEVTSNVTITENTNSTIKAKGKANFAHNAPIPLTGEFEDLKTLIDKFKKYFDAATTSN